MEIVLDCADESRENKIAALKALGVFREDLVLVCQISGNEHYPFSVCLDGHSVTDIVKMIKKACYNQGVVVGEKNIKREFRNLMDISHV